MRRHARCGGRRGADPVGGDRQRPEGPGLFDHLSCTDAERDLRVAESASVVLCAGPSVAEPDALRWIGDTLAARPGCLAAAASLGAGRHVVGLRDGRIVEASVSGPATGPERAAAVVYACLRAGLPLDGRVSLRFGAPREEGAVEDADEAVVLRTRPAPAPARG